MSTLDTFKVEVIDTCPLCESRDLRILHESMGDRLYGVPGEWTYNKCGNCALIFLNPRPTEEDIGAAYSTYPTHDPSRLPASLPRRLRSYIRDGYLARRFGYEEDVSMYKRVAGWLIYLHPGQREYASGGIMYLPANRRGRILDVGAGAGELLSNLRKLGWDVECVDPDTRAAESAKRNRGISIRTGTLMEQEYPSDNFDAITMSHVIEHVHDPVGLLAECRRILKPGGMLVVATPNAESVGLRYFGRDWRVLEPPRHLVLFSRDTLERAVCNAGLSPVQTKTTVRGADGVFIESRQLQTKDHTRDSVPKRDKLKAHIYQYTQSAIIRRQLGAGEELLMVANK